jgi:hypothetical protein
MKKIILTLKILLVFVAFTNMNAQIINGNFENVKPNFLPSNWGKAFAINEVIDVATGITTSDEVQYSSCMPGICYSNFGNSNTGQYALEMANAFNVTQNKLIIGGAVLFEDPTQDFPPGGAYNFNTSIVPFDSSIMYANQGVSLGFYYKFAPVGNDVAEANLELFDSSGNSVGKVAIPISGTNTDFNYIYSPVNFTSSATPISMSLSFTMAKEGSIPTFGSILIVDDVTINNSAAIALQTNTSVNEQFMIYPTITNQEINIRKGNSIIDGNYNFDIINTDGKLISKNNLSFLNSQIPQIDVSQLSNGIYFLKTSIDNKEQTFKFIKK